MAADNWTAEKIEFWKALHKGIEPELVQHPLITEKHAALGTMIEEADRMQREQETLLASLRSLNPRRRVRRSRKTEKQPEVEAHSRGEQRSAARLRRGHLAFPLRPSDGNGLPLQPQLASDLNEPG